MSNISKRRQSSSSDSGSGAYWMDTYGDMITLLFTFFVLLYSFSVIDIQKLREFSASYSNRAVVAIPSEYPPADISNVIEPIRSSSEKSDTSTSAVDEAFVELVKNVSTFVETHEIEAEVIPSYSEYTLTLRFNERVFFSPGSAAVLQEARPTLDAMIEMFETLQLSYQLLRIEGHTDNKPINTAQYPDNWALSQGRSGSVLGYILSKSNIIDAEKITVSGYSEYHPIDTNDTAEGRAKNRRVDFVIEGFRS